MTALNVVRFRVKPGRENDFIAAHRAIKEPFEGMRRAWLIKTGDRTYCMVGLWREQKNMVDARPAMLANLDKFRDCLEDLGGGLGVTDPVSGEPVFELGKDKKDKKDKKKDQGDKGASGAMAGKSPGIGGRGAEAAGGVAGRSRAERRAAKEARKKVGATRGKP